MTKQIQSDACSLRQQPDDRGYFGGRYGGCFVAETLMPLVQDLALAYKTAKADPSAPRKPIRHHN